MGIDKQGKKCYVLIAYTTDGSGRNHREYKSWKPTVWVLNAWTAAFFFKPAADCIW